HRRRSRNRQLGRFVHAAFDHRQPIDDMFDGAMNRFERILRAAAACGCGAINGTGSRGASGAAVSVSP
ncbi:MAG: hypothetical protein WBE14_25970, partial [Xanthobacteraceae bacterium]